MHPDNSYRHTAPGRFISRILQRIFAWKIRRENNLPGGQFSSSGLIKEQILNQLDHCARAGQFPMLDNGHLYLADTRLSAYRNDQDWALIIEVIGFNPRAGGVYGIENGLYCFGTCLRRPPGMANGDFLCFARDGFDGPAFQGGSDWHVRESVRTLYIRDTAVNLDLSPAALARKGIELAEPPHVNGEELLRSLIPEQRTLLLATDEELYERLTMRLPLALRLDEWHHPDLISSELPSQSEAFRQIAEVLASGDVSRYQPTQAPNTHWRNWPLGGTL